MNATFLESLVHVEEEGQNVVVLLKSNAPFLDQVHDFVLNLFRSFFVVKDCDENLHKVFASNLTVERVLRLIHEEVEQAEREEHHFGLRGLQTLFQLAGDQFCTVYSVIGFSDNGGCCFHVWLSEVDGRGPVDQLHDAV